MLINCWVVERSEATYCKVERSETVNTRLSVAREMVTIIVDCGGGGKICDEAEGEGAVDVNVDDDIDGGGGYSFRFC